MTILFLVCEKGETVGGRQGEGHILISRKANDVLKGGSDDGCRIITGFKIILCEKLQLKTPVNLPHLLHLYIHAVDGKADIRSAERRTWLFTGCEAWFSVPGPLSNVTFVILDIWGFLHVKIDTGEEGPCF